MKKSFLHRVILITLLAFVFGCAGTQTSVNASSHEATARDYARPGFVTKIEDGRLWVFIPGSKELEKFEKAGELAKHVIRPAAGPNRITLKAPDSETADAYMLAKPGFITRIEDGRLWVFKVGSKEFEKFEKAGELAKHIIRPAAGPNRMTLKAPDAETADAYLAAK